MKDSHSGAAVASYRLHKAISSIGMKSKMLVQRKNFDDNNIIGPSTKYGRMLGLMRPHIDQLPVMLYKDKGKALFSPSWLYGKKLIKTINELNPAIIHLNWIAGGMLRIEDIAKIKKPIVWTLHDMWAFTGGCHIDMGCGKFITHCGKCHALGSNKDRDLSFKIFRRKQKAYAKIKNLTIVGISRWLTESARQSVLLKGKLVVTLPNPIDTNIFKPLDKKVARKMLGIPEGKKVILFGAMSATTNPNKGFAKLSEALKMLNGNNIELVVFGSNKPLATSVFKFPTHYLGRFHDDLSLVVLYSAADVMVVPSIQEAFGQTATESMSCGTPVVAFDTTGLKDIVDHEINGYLARPYDPDDLAFGIKWILNNSNYNKLSLNAINKVKDHFEMKKVAYQYSKLYESILRIST